MRCQTALLLAPLKLTRVELSAYRLMKGLMLSPVIGAMLIGMGSGEVSQ